MSSSRNSPHPRNSSGGAVLNFVVTADGKLLSIRSKIPFSIGKRAGKEISTRALLEIDAVTELNLTITPLVFGGYQTPTLAGLPGDFLPCPLDFQLKSMKVVGGKCFLSYKRKSPLTTKK